MAGQKTNPKYHTGLVHLVQMFTPFLKLTHTRERT